jgi:endonuclease/exonuclease/phosphatase family metal-dependent hydrolase
MKKNWALRALAGIPWRVTEPPLAAALWFCSCAFAAEPTPIVVASYNLENYVGAESPEGPPVARRAKPKSEKSAAAVAHVIQEISPDILGVCEMGSPEQFAAFQERLRAAGLEYSQSEYVRAIDLERHLALLSRFPIIERHSQTNLTFDLDGAPHKMARGILDVTIRINPQYELRLLGVHLKSKLAAPEGEALIRRHEAEMLRKYVDAILTAAPETNLLLYGDFNDYKNEPPIQTITGTRGAARYLTELPAIDAAGERWTHYWKPADLYARIDYLFAGPALLHEIASGTTRIYSAPDWAEASDHRAILTAIVPVNRGR